MQKLTKRAVDSFKPRANGDYFIWDDDVSGFGLRIRPSGRKIYVLQYRDPAGASRRLVLGEHGPYTPEQARREAVQQRALVLAARRDPALPDPAQNRKRAKLASQASLIAPTVADVADSFLDNARAKLKPSTVYEYRRLLGITEIQRGPAKGKQRIGELRAALGRFKVADITKAQISKLHVSMEDRPYMANRALATLSALFTYAKDQGHRDGLENPCEGIREFKEHRRERLLTDAEYGALGEALRRAERDGLLPYRARGKATTRTSKHRPKTADTPKPANQIGVGVLRFLLLTGWREGEALTLKWAHVNFERKSATLPDTKTGRSERELGAPAVLLLEELRALRKKGNPYVFYGAKPESHFTDTARLWNSVRDAAGLGDVRIHDLRHGYASVGLASGLTLPVIGALLGHSDIRTTSRYAHLADSARSRAADLTASAISVALSSSTPQPKAVVGASKASTQSKRVHTSA